MSDRQSDPQPPTPSSFDRLDLPADLQKILRIVGRDRDLTAAAIAAQLNQEVATVEPLLQDLLQRGFLQVTQPDNVPHYRLRHQPRKRRNVPDAIWQKLEE